VDALPETRFAKSGGLDIAYQVVGDGPIDLVFVPGFMSHVELNWEYPFYAAILRELSSYTRLIVLDKRGTGLSDRSLGLGTFEDRMDDVRAVMDAAGSQRAALMGISEGAAMCVVMAATHPDRVSHLVITAGACPGVFDVDEENLEVYLDFIEAAWNTGAVIRDFIQHAPDTPEVTAAFARFERYCCTPAVAREIMRRNLVSDIRPIVPTVTSPTLVLHAEHDPLVSVDHARFYGERIPGARLEVLPGTHHGSWRAADYEPFWDLEREFLTGAAPPSRVDRVLSTVLFTDIADSTVLASDLGDARWRELLDGHDAAAAQEVAGHGGVLVKSTGDGILARFDGPSRAVACAHALRRRPEALGLRTRAEAHTGEIELRGDDVGGIAVHIAARVSGLADAGEVLVSRTVKDLSVGSGLTFEDRGEHELKGVPERWHVYAATA
jgi:pimeloyl-ACP methyl ester carboxylesterase